MNELEEQFDNLQNRIDILIKLSNEITAGVSELVKEFVTNKNHPLEERWETFIKSGMGRQEPFIENWDNFDNDWITPDGPFYCYKYETIRVSDMVIFLEARYPELVDQFKEEVLSRFIKSYVFDW